ncbi:MAG: ribonuclease HII [Saprospiraceae bacterium]|nr:ribonuclease HII [Lewinella sp.]
MPSLLPYHQAAFIEAGCDEAGRGCLAGPVFAAAVILPRDFEHPLLNDSKQLSERQRNEARQIVEREAISWAVGQVDPKEIDEINILNASFLAMHRALDQLDFRPESLLIDGNRFEPYGDLPFHCMIKGDGRFLSIAAASILAKTYRDDLLKKLHEQFPQYGWDRNKGYPTAEHRKAILKHGATLHHRRSFRLLPDAVQGKLF